AAAFAAGAAADPAGAVRGVWRAVGGAAGVGAGGGGGGALGVRVRGAGASLAGPAQRAGDRAGAAHQPCAGVDGAPDDAESGV
ncbi:MAG: hypothetical protein AVDCRST_MAG89-4066, partial [uncultured Gemmatimonadetes bacterium]